MIPDLERKILSDLHKSKAADNYIKAPMKPERKPIDPDPNALPRKYPDENPLEQYLKAFEEFLPILKLNADEYTRGIENEEK